MWVIIEGSFSYIRASHLYKSEAPEGVQNRGIKEAQWTSSTWHPRERNFQFGQNIVINYIDYRGYIGEIYVLHVV